MAGVAGRHCLARYRPCLSLRKPSLAPTLTSTPLTAAVLVPLPWAPPQMPVKVAQLYLTLCNPMDYTVRGILQARLLEWIVIPFSRGASQPRNRTRVSCIAGIFFTS